MKYVILSAGFAKTCALKDDGHALCWGYEADSPEPDTPDGLVSITAGGPGACGLQSDGLPSCWGDWGYLGANAPDVPLVQLDMMASGVGGLDADGVPYFWGGDWHRDSDFPRGERFKKLSMGIFFDSDDEAGCGITPDDVLLCWGNGPDGRQSPPALDQPVLDVDLGQHHGCALLQDGSVTCWGTDVDNVGLLEPPI